MSDLTFEPLIPSSLWLALAVGGVAVLAWYLLYRPASVPKRRWGLMAVFMSAAVALVLALLLNPTWAHQIDSSGGKPLVTILLDATKSMATPDATGGVTRFAAASQTAREIADSLGANFDVRVETFDRSIKLVDPQALNNLGVLFMRQGNTADAQKEFEEAVRVAPDFDQPYLNLAQLYMGRGEKTRAREILQGWLARHPDHAAAKGLLEQVGN